MEEQVGLRQVNHRAGDIFRSVVPGREIVVTEHGKPRWRIVPYVEDSDSLDDLVRRGAVQPPRSDLVLPDPVRASSGRSSAEILADLKGDR